MELLEPEIWCPAKRRRGPKPLSVRAKFAATAWLDGDVLWRDGRVVWRHDERIVAVGARELEAVSRALGSLKRHEKTARRSCADFDAWHARRVEQWEKACHLAAIRAPDLETLVSLSRRRNPAALERLAALLAVEASVAEPLPVSPARALFAAWPYSQEAVRRLLRAEDQPIEARALAALVIGAAQPLEALPGEPFLRRAARYGARFGFPRAPLLVVALLQNGGRDAETSVSRVEKALENSAPFGFDAAQLLALQRAGQGAALVADFAEAANRLPDPFPPLSFSPVLPKRFDLSAQRALSGSWNELRIASHREFRDVLAQIARRGDARDVEWVSELMEQLISAPLRALGEILVEKGRPTKRREREIPAFAASAAAAVAEVLKLLKAVADAPDWGVLALLQEILPQCKPCEVIEDLSPAAWAARWESCVMNHRRGRLTPVLNLARDFGVAAAREALRLDCWKELSRHRQLQPELFHFALQIKAWAPDLGAETVHRIAYLGPFWKGAAGARAALQPIIVALNDAPSSERAVWLGEVLNGIEWSRRGARRQLPALARFLPAMRRVWGAGGDKLERWTLVEVALGLWEIAPDEAAAMEARFGWLADEMTRRVAVDAGENPGWKSLADLVGFLSQLAPRDEAKFRELMGASWRFANSDTDFKWPEVKRGAKIAREIGAFQTALCDNFARCPARCFALLEKLGPLDQFEPLRAPLQAWQERAQVAPRVDWPLEFNGEFAARFVAAKRELGEAETPPAGMLKIAEWPRKIEAEIAALRARGELPLPLTKRLENLLSRLENRAELDASMRREMEESLRNATVEAELRVAELVVESCYRARLEVLGAPKNVVLNADLMNAALLSTDIDLNRKWLREIVRAHCESRQDWRGEIEGNARFLQALSERGVNIQEWLAEAPQGFVIGEGRIELRLEACPLRILQMGNYFDTCLSRGGCNAFSSVANAVELNKRVVFARDAKGRVVGRQLLALSSEGRLLGFHVYASLETEKVAALRCAFGSYARDFAARCGLELGDGGEVERLFVSDWYDDGAIVWSDLLPVENAAKSQKL